MSPREPRVSTEKITCPSCGCAFSKVVPRNLLQDETHGAYSRHRRCEECSCEYETSEMVVKIFRPATSRATNPGA